MHEITRRILATLLTHMEGFNGKHNTKDQSLLICATNRKQRFYAKNGQVLISESGMRVGCEWDEYEFINNKNMLTLSSYGSFAVL